MVAVRQTGSSVVQSKGPESQSVISHLILLVKVTGRESLTMAISESSVLESQAWCWMALEILMSTGLAPSLLVEMSWSPSLT